MEGGEIGIDYWGLVSKVQQCNMKRVVEVLSKSDIQGRYRAHRHRGLLGSCVGLRGNCECRKSFRHKRGKGLLGKEMGPTWT